MQSHAGLSGKKFFVSAELQKLLKLLSVKETKVRLSAKSMKSLFLAILARQAAEKKISTSQVAQITVAIPCHSQVSPNPTKPWVLLKATRC